MPVVHDFRTGHFYHTVELRPDAPLVHKGHTFETDPPFREARPVIVRLWPSKTGLVLGRFRETGKDEDQALTDALSWDLENAELDLLDADGHILPLFEPEAA